MKAKKATESVWDYPRPPRVEASAERIVLRFAGRVILDTTSSYRVLETSHPPTYYLPKRDLIEGVLEPVRGTSYCEWKGAARYFDIVLDGGRAERAAWEYAEPRKGYEMLAGHISIYAAHMEAVYVDDERIEAQEGDYYGGWISSNVRGPFKGGPNSVGW